MELRYSGHAKVRLRQRRIRRTWCRNAIENPVHSEVQSNGRTAYWGYITERDQYLKVIVKAGRRNSAHDASRPGLQKKDGTK